MSLSASLFLYENDLPVDEMNSECEVTIVDVEAVRTLVHRSIAPLRSFLRPNLPSLIHDIAVAVFNIMNLNSPKLLSY